MAGTCLGRAGKPAPLSPTTTAARGLLASNTI
jgi:hypothetical protein